MSNLENQPFWPELLRLKDTMPLKALSKRFATTPGAISAALKRTGTTRTASTARTEPTGDLPPEPGEADSVSAAVARALKNIRPGSKDTLISTHAKLLGRRPDAEVAEAAGVSVRTVASFRARHGIPGYRGPRRSTGQRGQRRSRIDPHAHLLGKVPDRVVAEQAGVSLNAVRNYRVKRGIAAAGRRAPTEVVAVLSESMEIAAVPPALESTPARLDHFATKSAWRVTWELAGHESHAIIVAQDLVHAARQAEAAGLPGPVCRLEHAGRLLD